LRRLFLAKDIMMERDPFVSIGVSGKTELKGFLVKITRLKSKEVFLKL